MQTRNLLKEKGWKLRGWRPNYWLLTHVSETGDSTLPEYGPYEVELPTSVQKTLKANGVIQDWNHGMQSLACEWVEHRHWEFFKELDLPSNLEGNVTLEAMGLDYSGWIYIGKKRVGEFSGTLKRFSFDLKPFIEKNTKPLLRIIFDRPPEEQGQIGYTSKSHLFKPRFSYSWDWCFRFVPIGIGDTLNLLINAAPKPVKRIQTTYSQKNQIGVVQVHLNSEFNRTEKLSVKIQERGSSTSISLKPSTSVFENRIDFIIEKPELWYSNGAGKQALYEYEIRSETSSEIIHQGVLGFKEIRWLQNTPKIPTARPLLCEINGKPLFIQGVNWTPVEMDYLSDHPERYRRLISLYREMGVNLLRIWGGAHLEKELFYQLCDEAGLMVWQEFPLCSAGVDNYPPDAPETIQALLEIADNYIQRCATHVALSAWCGGNELQTHKNAAGNSVPISEAHPIIQALQKLTTQETPEIYFLPTSPSGPVFGVTDETRGKGLHHHVHAPWDHSDSWETWKKYWDADDALLRAEIGVAGCSNPEIFLKYTEAKDCWPPTVKSRFWNHTSPWWVQPLLLKEIKSASPQEALSEYIHLSQERQGRFLAYAAMTCKKRFPECSGIIIWMGHDAIPIASNTSIIDFDLNPKPAYEALKKIFNP